jgi:uncharacterized membrane protein YoaT (DUF817 family)
MIATYTFYNLLLAVVILTFAYWITGRNSRILFLAARVALLITLLLYPWDFFAVRLGVWVYPKDPGLTIYGVPFNDSVFIWLCSFLASVVLLEVDRRSSGNQADTERYKTVENNRHDER